MKARSCVLVCLSIVVLQACGASRKLSEDKAKEKISELQLIHFKDKQIQVQRIVHAGEDQAVVEANVPLAFRLSKSDKHDWEINAIRLGDRDWIESQALLAALSEVRVRQTRESLQRLQEGIQKYRAKTGTLPDTSSIAKLTDALFPNYMPEVIRYDAWNHELTVRLKSENSCEIVSAGPDGILGNDDDLSSGST